MVCFTAISNVKFTTFTANGTFTPDANMAFCYVWVKGAGAAGGGAVNTSSGGAFSTGSGGGEGGETFAWLRPSDIGSSQTVVVGIGGVGVSGANGNPGSNTTFGAILTAVGGNQGVTVGPTNADPHANGGFGGPALGGLDNKTGQPGGDSTGFGSAGWPSGGEGGGLQGGSRIFQYNNGSTAGRFAGYIGCGGSGAASENSNANTGGNGSNGAVYVTEYLSG